MEMIFGAAFSSIMRPFELMRLVLRVMAIHLCAFKKLGLSMNRLCFVYNKRRRKEITSYLSAMDPSFYNLREQEKEIHFLARKDLKRIHACTSHLVLLIDTSGSMRNSDV